MELVSHPLPSPSIVSVSEVTPRDARMAPYIYIFTETFNIPKRPGHHRGYIYLYVYTSYCNNLSSKREIGKYDIVVSDMVREQK